MTHSEIRAEVYNALKTDNLLIDNILWLNNPTKENKFPLIVYRILDAVPDYDFCGRSSEMVQIQIDLYFDAGEIAFGDAQHERIIAVMEGLKYRMVGGSPEFVEDSVNKIVKISRWETIVV